MKDYFFVTVLCMLIAAPQIRSARKRKEPMISILNNLNKRVEYEFSHKNMFSTADEFKIWPDLTNGIQMELCKKYINNLFKVKKKLVVTTLLTHVHIYYPEIEKRNNQSYENVLAASLRCEILPPAESCKFLFFIRSPQNECLYLLQHRITSSKEFYIIGEICEFGQYNYWHLAHTKRTIRKHKFPYKRKSVNDSADKLKEHEANHLNDYLLHTDFYVKWSEFRKKSAKELCLVLLNKIYPQTNFSMLDASDEKLQLHYSKIQNVGKIVSNVIVGSLKCNIVDRKYENCFRFIKAPLSTCMHLVKQINPRSSIFYIAKLFCEDNDVSRTEDEVILGNEERQNIPGIKYEERKKDSQYGDERQGECDEYEEKCPLVTNITFQNFI